MFDNFTGNPVLMFALGMAAVVMVVAPVLWRQWQKIVKLKNDNAALARQSEQRQEILDAVPDGLFLWDPALGREKCSRRLAVLLGLDAGTRAGFADVLSRFGDSDAESLAHAVGDLRRDGSPFDLLLDLNGRQIQAMGSRAATLDGRVLNDLMWVRDVTDAAGTQQQEPAPLPVDDKKAVPSDAFEHFTFMLDALPLAVWIRDGGLNVIFANRAAQRLGVVEGRADAATAKLARKALAEKKPAGEQRLIDSKKGPVLVTRTEVPVRGWSGTVGFALDHTATKAGNRGHDVVPVDGQIDQKMFDHLGTAVALFDDDTRLTFANSAFGDLWDLGMDWLADGPTMVEILDHLRAHRSLPEVTDFPAFKERQLALFGNLNEPEVTLLHLPDGRTIRRLAAPYSAGGLFFSFEDNTGRLVLERSFKALDAVQRETLDHLYEGIAVFGGDGRLKLCNPVLASIWKLAPERLDESLHISDFIHATRPLVAGPDGMDDKAWTRHVKKVIAGFAERRTVTGRMTLSNGMIIDYSNVALPDGATLLSYLDVSDSARVEAALRQRAEALDQANRLKSEFIANVSDEVTAPLATLIGYADILAQENYGELNTRQKEYSNGILENAQNLMDVISDILDIATIEAGMMALQLDTVELHTMLASLVHLIRERARRKALKVNFDCPPDIGWIVADEKRLRQVLFNLLSNAINFTPPRGAITLSAERSGKGENETIVFKVADTGRGIPKSRQLDIFDAFGHGQQDANGEEKNGRTGAGLGLNLVKRFVELHGGTVHIKSPPGRGTTVTCTLPASGRKQTNLQAVAQQDIA